MCQTMQEQGSTEAKARHYLPCAGQMGRSDEQSTFFGTLRAAAVCRA